VYEFRGVKIVRTNKMHTIKMVRIEKNTMTLDPTLAYGAQAVRVYIALHVLLNTRSLTRAVIRSIRELGFRNTIAGRCIVNIPVQAMRYSKQAGKNEVMTMYGINRIVRIVPRDKPFVYVRSSTITHEMLDIFASTVKGKHTLKISPTLLNCMHGLVINCEPEIEAAITHARMCGVPPKTPLYGTPVILEQTVAQISNTTPGLLAWKRYAYPRRKMEEYRRRYLVQDEHASDDIASRMRAFVPSMTEAKRSARNGKLENPTSELLGVINQTGLKSLVDFLVPAMLVNRPDVTFDQVLSQFQDKQELRTELLSLGVTEKDFMDVCRNYGTKFTAQRIASRFEIGVKDKMDRRLKLSKLAQPVPERTCPVPPHPLDILDEVTIYEGGAMPVDTESPFSKKAKSVPSSPENDNDAGASSSSGSENSNDSAVPPAVGRSKTRPLFEPAAGGKTLFEKATGLQSPKAADPTKRVKTFVFLNDKPAAFIDLQRAK